MSVARLLVTATCSVVFGAAPVVAQEVPTIRWLRGDNQVLNGERESAPVSHRIANDPSLTRETTFLGTSDTDDIRAELSGIAPETVIDAIRAESVDAAGRVRDRQALTWVRGPGNHVRTSFLRLVGDVIDRTADGNTHHTLQVALSDRVRVTATTGARSIASDIHVGLSSAPDSPFSPRFARVRASVLRTTMGGPTVIGRDDAHAIDIVRHQLEGANQIWLQCFISFGDPARADIVVVDPPPPSLLAIADEDGLPAFGGGIIRLRANDVVVDAGPTRADATPVETAMTIAESLRKAGFQARVTENPSTEFGAGRSADIVVRDARGKVAILTAVGGQPISSDRRQSAVIGSVDLGDGLAEFNNMTASAGSLEERTLIKTLADEDPTTIDLVVVNRFTFGTRQGEAFIENGGGPIHNVVVLDRVGLRQQHTAFTLPHELGHVLLNQPYHPDNVGPDAPWLLMDADSNAGTVTGPKRLTWDECHRARSQSAESLPVLLNNPANTAPKAKAAVERR